MGVDEFYVVNARCGEWFFVLVNFIIVYDGFMLCDFVSYNEKYNEVNGEENKDGIDDNCFWNCGVEGLMDDLLVFVLCL